MCIPLAVAAGISAIAGVAGAGMSAYGAAQSGKAAKEQARLNAAQSEMQSQLANFNADQAEMFGKLNAGMVTSIAGLNDKLSSSVASTNVALIGATTDFNVGTLKSTMDFNVSSSEGAARLLEAEGAAQAQTHGFNAKIDEFQAQNTLEQGNQAERQSRTGYAQLKGEQRATLAANGVTLDEGSSLRIQSDTDYASDVDAATIKTNAIKTALGYRIQGANEQMAGTMASLNGKAQAMDKYAEAVQSKLNGEVAITQAKVDGAVKTLDTKMTSSFQILQNDMDAQVQSLNITNQAKSDAWAMRAQAIGYQGQAAQARLTASSINPALMAGTSLLSGVSQAFGSYAQLSAAGVYGGKKGK